MMKIGTEVALVAVMLALVGCDGGGSSTQNAAKPPASPSPAAPASAPAPAAAPAQQILQNHGVWATLPNGNYTMWCVDKRATVLAIDPALQNGWNTQRPVVLSPVAPGPAMLQAGAKTACQSRTDLIESNDELQIMGSAGNFTLSFKHRGQPMNYPLTAAPNEATPMWYQTAAPAPGSNPPIQYFVYVLNQDDAGSKVKRYMLESFLMEDTNCLNERPTAANVVQISDTSQCPSGGILQNGTGVGNEPH